MSALWTTLLSCAGVLAIGVVAGALKDEVCGRIDRLPRALLGLAERRLPQDVRADLAEEWKAELDAILTQAEGLPITRLAVGTTYSLGLLRVGPEVADELMGVSPAGLPRRTWLLVGGVLAVVAIVMSTSSSRAPGTVAVPDTRRAKEAVTAVLSFDYRRLDQDIAAAHALTTPLYRADYDRQLQAGDWRARLRDNRGAVRTDIIDSAVVSSSGDTVTILAFVKRTVTAADAEPSLLKDSMRLTMVRQGSSWLLNTLSVIQTDSVPYTASVSPESGGWPGAKEQAAIDAVSRHPAVAVGTRIETAVRPGGSDTALSVLVAVGECARDACKSTDKVSMYRMELQQQGNGGWQISRTERL